MKEHPRFKFEQKFSKKEKERGWWVFKNRSNKRAKYGLEGQLFLQPYKALLNYTFSKVYYVLAFNPITLKFSNLTNV